MPFPRCEAGLRRSADRPRNRPVRARRVCQAGAYPEFLLPCAGCPCSRLSRARIRLPNRVRDL